MPLKDGSLTKYEQAFCIAFAELGDREAARLRAGISVASAYQMLQRPELQREIAAQQQALIATDLFIHSVSAAREIVTNPKSPAAARVSIIKLVWDRMAPTGADAARALEPHEMSAEQLSEAINRLNQIVAGAVDVTPRTLELEAVKPAIFD